MGQGYQGQIAQRATDTGLASSNADRANQIGIAQGQLNSSAADRALNALKAQAAGKAQQRQWDITNAQSTYKPVY